MIRTLTQKRLKRLRVHDIKQWLQITKLQHNPQDPYALKDLYEAAGYCLLSTAPAGSMDAIRSDMSLAPSPLVDIKTELQSEVQSVIKTAMTKVTKMFKNVFAAQAQLSGSGQTSSSQMRALNVARLPPDQSNAGKCNFCGECYVSMARSARRERGLVGG
jgi:hypothetical protein